MNLLSIRKLTFHFQLMQYIILRFGSKNVLLSRIEILLQKYKRIDKEVADIKDLSKALCEKDFFLEDTSPNELQTATFVGPCIVGSSVFLGNNFF
jgi:hypothetical protein